MLTISRLRIATLSVFPSALVLILFFNFLTRYESIVNVADPVLKPSASSHCESFRQTILESIDDIEPSGKWNRDEDGYIVSGRWLGSNQAMEGCLSFDARHEHVRRYATMADKPVLSACNPNLEPGAERQAVLIRMAAQNFPWSEDQVLSMRAIVLELGWVMGMDVVILRHINPLDPPDDSAIPDDLRELVKDFTDTDLMQSYPEDIFRILDQDQYHLLFPMVALYNHIAPIWFYHSMQARGVSYDYIYTIEYDVRNTGFWHSLIRDVQKQWIVQSEQKLTMPDLLTFSPLFPTTPEWVFASSKSAESLSREEHHHGLLQVYGQSPALLDAIHRALLSGKNDYFEAFPPTVAVQGSLKSFVYLPPTFHQKNPVVNAFFPQDQSIPDVTLPVVHSSKVTYGNIFDPQQIGYYETYFHAAYWNNEFYSEWKSEVDGESCRPGTLIHPVKQ